MEQSKIWDHFQNNEDTGGAFDGASPRYSYIADQIASGVSVLNVGVGRGGLESYLIGKNCRVSCLDPSASSIARLRELYRLGDRARTGFSQAMPFEDGEFDVVVMSEVLEHLAPEVLALTLAEVKRVLKVGGSFIGTVPANENLTDNGAICPDCGKSFHRWGHVQSFTPERIRTLLQTHQFIVKTCSTRAFPDWRRRGLRNFCKSVIRYLLGRNGAAVASPNIFFRSIR